MEICLETHCIIYQNQSEAQPTLAGIYVLSFKMCLHFCKTHTTVEVTEKRRELLAVCRVTLKRWEVDGMTVVGRARPVLKSYSQSPGIQPVAVVHVSHALEKETVNPSPRGDVSNWTHWTGSDSKKKQKTQGCMQHANVHKQENHTERRTKKKQPAGRSRVIPQIYVCRYAVVRWIDCFAGEVGGPLWPSKTS